MRALLVVAGFLLASTAYAAPAPIPLVDYHVPGAQVRFDIDTLKSDLQWQGSHVTIPESAIVTDMAAHGSDIYLATRKLFGDTIGLWQMSEGTLHALPSPIEHLELLTQSLYVDNGALYLLAYDTHAQTNQLFRRPLDAKPSNAWENDFRPALEFIAPYELNVPMFRATHNGHTMICGGETCYTLEDDVAVAHRASARGYTLLDVATDGKATFGLYMRQVDDRFNSFPRPLQPYYFVRQLPDGRMKALNASQIPHRLSVKDRRPYVTYLKTEQDATDSYFDDFAKLPNAGTALIGTTNRDGRQSWGQIYYLNGLLDLISTKYNPPLLPLSEAQRTAIADRLTLEMQLLDRLLASEEWLYSRRYSIKRAPLAASMHLSRALRIMKRYADEHPHPVAMRSFETLKKETLRLDRTFTQPDVLPDGRHYLRYVRGSAFWSDGLNVPHNYQTGWAEGLVVGYGDTVPEAAKPLLRGIFSIWYDEEIAKRLGTRDWQWRYWWGQAFDGYTKEQNLSDNTPEYAGDPLIAHISYRTMDSMAALEVMKRMPDILPAQVKSFIAEGVERGTLYPFTLEAFEPDDRPCIPYRVARFYARYPSVYEMQNAVWALSALHRRCN